MDWIIPNNIQLGADEGTIFWYIWGNDIDFINVVRKFRLIFRGLLELRENVQTIIFYIDNIKEDKTESGSNIVSRDNIISPIHKHILNKMYSSFISEMVMIGKEKVNTFYFDENEKKIKAGTINFEGLNYLIAGQLNYLQLRIRQKIA